MKVFSFMSRYSRWCDRSGLLVISLFLIALSIRLSALGRYVTPDELIWVYRSVLFREALLAGAWGDTLVAGHPGVITTWLGAIGIGTQLMLRSADLDGYQWITQLAWLTPDNMLAFQQLDRFLSAGRFLVASVNSIGIVAVFFLARRLFTSCLALLLAFLLAIDPFFAGLSGLLHVDGLATTFVMLSLLSLVLAVDISRREEKWRSRLVYAAISGGTAALAVLSKSPALLLLPLAAGTFFLLIWRNRSVPLLDRLRSSFFLGLVWIGSFFLLAFLIFPALWASPGQVLQLAGGNANRHLVEALRPTFFLGQVAYDHGALFYPVALAWRIGPAISVGLLLLAALMFRRDDKNRPPLSIVLIFALWTLLFIVVITVTAKKFDRYALPVIPALTVLAVIGWGYWLQKGNRWGWLILIFLVAIQIIYTLFVLPYPMSAYNPLLGGPLTARHIMPIGWGESVSSAGQWLAGEADVGQRSAVSGIAPSLAPFFPGITLLAEDQEDFLQADYIIFTANSRQNDPQGVEKATVDLDLMHIIRYGGLDQSWIYSNPNPIGEDLRLTDLPSPISFAGKIKLLSQDLRVSNGEIRFAARWESQSADGRFLVKLKVLDENGHTWADLETALLNEVYFYPENWAPGETPVITYELDLAPTVPPGKYRVELSLVDEAIGAQLPVLEEGSFSGVIYEVGEVLWDEPGTASSIGLPDFVPIDDATSLKGSPQIIGYSLHPERVVAGANLLVDVFWQADEVLSRGMKIALQIGNEEPIILPLSHFDSGDWQPGRIVQAKYRLPVPADMIAESTSVRIWPLTADDQSFDEKVELGNVDIMAIDRLFILPDDIPLPTTVKFEPHISLRGVAPSSASSTVGGKLLITLYWQTENQTDQPVTAFVHLVDESGEIVAQIDRWPGGLPSNIWTAGQVIIDEYELQIPSNVQPGEYQIAVGLYYANDGHRLPASDHMGQRLSDDRVILPLWVEIRP